MDDFTLLIIIVTGLANLGLGFWVLFSRRTARINQTFFILIITILLWLVNNYLADHSGKISTALIFTKNLMYFAFLIPMVIFYFSLIFPKKINPTGLLRKSLISLSAFAMFVLIYITDFIIKNVYFENKIAEIDFGTLSSLYLLTFILFSIFATTNFMNSYRKNIGIAKLQVKYFALGILISLSLTVFTNLILPLLFGIYLLTPFGSLFTIIFIAFTAYAIVAHRLFDIRVIIKRTVIFAGLSVFVLGSYSLILFVVASLFGLGSGGNQFSVAQMVPNLLAALAIAVGFEPLRQWLSRRTDKWLFKGEYTPQQVLKDLATTLTNVIDLAEAMEEMMLVVTKAMRLTKAATFLVQPGEHDGEYELKRAVTVGFRHTTPLTLAPRDSLVSFFLQTQVSKQRPGLVVVEELRRQLDDGTLAHERAELTAGFILRLEHLNGAVALPLFIIRQQPVPTPPGTPARFREVETFIGVLVLGEKKSGDAFTDQDLKLLDIVASQTAGAVEKSRLFEEDQLKSEFVAVASHELLTPTAAMQGYLSMILDEGMGKVDKRARTYLTTVYSEAKRLAALVKDLLNVSRIERGKIVVHSEPLDLIAAIQQVIDSLIFRAKERKISLNLATAKPALPQVMADSEKLAEVLVNLIGNAIKYTPEGGKAEITTEVRGTQVLIHIKDNGIGMKPEDMQHLFSKFFRASNSDQTKQGGTGLGLYITKSIIELMGGAISVESQLNKGSTFTFSLPIAK